MTKRDWEITPEAFKKERDDNAPYFLLDVREPEEFALANLGGTLIPMGELPQRLDELNPSDEIIVMCHHGIRSAHATLFLRQKGFSRARNLVGGIDAWSIRIDSAIARY